VSDSVLDLIDHALDAHGDAMRWSPNAPDPTPAPWPHVERRYVPITFALLDEPPFLGRLEPAWSFPATITVAILDEPFLAIRRHWVARKARLRRMRHLYRQRRR
jgi:hypothetical protein